MATKPFSFRPMVETLEDRLTPATVFDPLTLNLPPTLAAARAAHGPRADVPFMLQGEWVLSDIPAAGNLVTLRGAGTATQLGKWSSFGEIRFEAGAQPGSLVGTGVIAFEAANGEMVVAALVMEIDPDGSADFGLSWRDSITLSDGTEVVSTGRFVDPPFSGVGGTGNFRFIDGDNRVEFTIMR